MEKLERPITAREPRRKPRNRQERFMREDIRENNMCDFCEKAVPLVEGKTNDYGIELHYPNKLIAYGYDVHGGGSNGLIAKINFCPICGRKLGRVLRRERK